MITVVVDELSSGWCPLLLIDDRLEPRGAGTVGCALKHGEVAHEVVLVAPWHVSRRVGCRRVARAHADHGAVAGDIRRCLWRAKNSMRSC
jgi:hypothetical protein